MPVIDHSATFIRSRANERAKETEERRNQFLEEKTRQGKCCSYVETGTHPIDDWHLCLRPKSHKGYHKDEFTNFQWRWD